MNSTGDVGLMSSAGISSTPSFSPSQLLNAKTMIINQNTSNNSDTQNALGEASNVKWTKINDVATSQSIQPRPRHGHRAVAYGNYMIVFGGGNEGIVEELHVFDTTTHEWFQPQTKGDIPPGCAAYGLVLDGCRMLLYGGMIEYGRYSSDLYELSIPKWEWKKLKPKGPRNGETPCARLGHSFTIIRDQVFLFGGLANDSDDLKNNIPRYLNDMYTLQVRLNNENGIWDIPVTFGSPPGPRESHTAVAYVSKDSRFNKLIIYGGMSGCRLGDLYILDVDTLMWCKPEVGGATPSPRSLHTATLVGEKMYVFGGWVPMLVEELKNSEKEWKCTNSLACLNVESLTWENLHQDILDDKVPRARAGHSAVVINTRIYIWSGRDGYRKAWNNQVCCKDLWQLEVQKPGDPGKVQLLRAGTNWLEVGWNPVPGADSYILQCVAYDVPSDPIFQSEPSAAQPLQSLAAAGYAPTPPIMTPVPISKPAKSAVPPIKEILPPTTSIAAASSAPAPIQVMSSIGNISMTPPQSVVSPAVTSSTILVSLPNVVSQSSLPVTSLAVPVAASMHQQQPSENSATSVMTLSMPSLAPTATTVATDTGTAVTVVSATSISPAVLPSASSLYTLPANVAGTVSSLFASKTAPRPVMTPVTTSPSAGRGVLRLRTPVQVGQPGSPRTVVTSLPSGATVLKTPSIGTVLSSSASDSVSSQMSGMHTLAAAAAATQKIQTPPQTLKVVQQSPGQPQVFSQVKVANVSGVLPTTVRLSSPVTSTGKPGAVATATATTGNVKQIIVQKPGGPGTGNQIYTVVKTSQGMALANLQGSKVIQGKPGVTTTNVVPVSSIQGSPQKTANIIKWVAAPGSGVTTVSKPNIIATNQPIIGLAGQGTSGTGPRPTYIISKPATTMANRPQTPQYVVVTQASAIRSIQGMAANSLSGSQTITLPTSVATGGQPQGVKMIVMPSASGAATAGQSVKIITPSGMQTANAPKTVTLATSKPAQYITSSGQIVTLPPGLLQPGSQQQISIGGKQVTLQMAGGQKLAILSNSSGQFVQTSQSSGDAGKPKFVMVGTGQKTTLPASNPMRCTVSVGGVLQPDSTTTTAVAEGMIEMASGGASDHSAVDQQNLNGVNTDGDQGGLKGGSMYGPWSSYCFAGLPWMKLKGGGMDQFEYSFNCQRDSTIPIYSASTKFSWRDKINFGLKGGAEGDGEESSSQPVQDTPATPPSEATQQPTSSETEQESTSGSIIPIPDEATSSTDNLPGKLTLEKSNESQCVPTSTTEIPTPADAVVKTEPTESTQSDTAIQKPLTVQSVVKEEKDILPQQQSQQGLQQIPTSSTDEPMDVSEQKCTTSSGDAAQEPHSAAVPFTVAPTETPMDTSAPSGEMLPVSTQVPTVSVNLPAESVSQLTNVQLQQQPAVPQSTQQLTQQSAASQPTQQILVQQPSLQTPLTQQPMLQKVTTQAQSSTVSLQVSSQQPTLQQPTGLQATVSGMGQMTSSVVTTPSSPSVAISTALPVTSANIPPPPVVNLTSGIFSVGTQPSLVMQPSPSLVSLQQSTPSIPSLAGSASVPSTRALAPPLPVMTSTPELVGQPPVSAGGGTESGQPIVARLTVPNASVIRAQVPDTRLSSNTAQSVASTQPSPSTNGTAPSQTTTVQVRLPAAVPEEKIDNWMDVIHTRSTNTIVKCYFTTNEKLSRLEPDIPVDKDLEFIKKKVELKPATAYKFRVAAINSCGRGPWGEVTAFKTCLPGFPGAPSSIKISKSVDGATIAWEPPLNTPGDILEYSVYLAVKPPPNAPEPKPGVTNLSFVRVYCGPSNQCNVPTASLNQALVDTTSKPAIIFRIAAKNDKGYGPATQVRWLQESAAPNFSSPKTGILKRAAPFAPSAVAKRGRADGN